MRVIVAMVFLVLLQSCVTLQSLDDKEFYEGIIRPYLGQEVYILRHDEVNRSTGTSSLVAAITPEDLANIDQIPKYTLVNFQVPSDWKEFSALFAQPSAAPLILIFERHDGEKHVVVVGKEEFDSAIRAARGTEPGFHLDKAMDWFFFAGLPSQEYGLHGAGRIFSSSAVFYARYIDRVADEIKVATKARNRIIQLSNYLKSQGFGSLESIQDYAFKENTSFSKLLIPIQILSKEEALVQFAGDPYRNIYYLHQIPTELMDKMQQVMVMLDDSRRLDVTVQWAAAREIYGKSWIFFGETKKFTYQALNGLSKSVPSMIPVGSQEALLAGLATN